MRALFVLCTTLTFLEVFDVSITGVSALQVTVDSALPTNNEAEEKEMLSGKPFTPLLTANAIPTSQTAPIPEEIPEVSRMVARGLPVKSAPPKPTAKAVNDKEDKEGHSDDSTDSEPTTIVDSSKHLVNTVKDETKKRGAGAINTVTDVVKLGSDTLGLFGKLIRDQTKNVHVVAKDSLGLFSGLGKNATKGAQNVLKSAGEIGKESANTMDKTLKSATDLGKSALRLKGNVINVPLSVGSDVVNLANTAVVAPTKLSRFVTSNINNTLKPILGDHEEENPANEEDSTPPPPSKKPASKK